MNREVVLPIEWNNFDEQDTLTFTFYDVTFIDNFGIFFKGEKFQALDILYDGGIVEARDENGIIKQQKFIFSPIFDENIKVPKTENIML